MPDGKYHNLVLIPDGSDFTLSGAVDYFSSIGRKCHVMETSDGGMGFRLYFDDWTISAWLEEGEHICEESKIFARIYVPLPAPIEVIEHCCSRLSVWSDVDCNLIIQMIGLSRWRGWSRGFPSYSFLTKSMGSGAYDQDISDRVHSFIGVE
jgi:hypothetical protein